MQVHILPKQPDITKPTHTHTHTLSHAHITKPTHTHTHTYAHPHIHTPTHYKTHTHTHTHTLQNPHTHTHTHTHTNYKTHTHSLQYKLQQPQYKTHSIRLQIMCMLMHQTMAECAVILRLSSTDGCLVWLLKFFHVKVVDVSWSWETRRTCARCLCCSLFPLFLKSCSI
jgi:hypothetical protein